MVPVVTHRKPSATGLRPLCGMKLPAFPGSGRSSRAPVQPTPHLAMPEATHSPSPGLTAGLIVYPGPGHAHSAELYRSLEVLDRGPNSPKLAQNRSESVCAGLWVPPRAFLAWLRQVRVPTQVTQSSIPSRSPGRGDTSDPDTPETRVGSKKNPGLNSNAVNIFLCFFSEGLGPELVDVEPLLGPTRPRGGLGKAPAGPPSHHKFHRKRWGLRPPPFPMGFAVGVGHSHKTDDFRPGSSIA
jgi:hypothetical protein